MTAALGIFWFVGLLLSIYAIFQTVGSAMMVNFFPEGRRWWQFPSQLVSLAVFAAFCINHPF
ncbi:hypothetical protein [Pseudomonas gregormendelii]